MGAVARARSFVRTKVLGMPPRASYVDPHRLALEKSMAASRQLSPRGLVSGARVVQGIWMPITRPEGLVLLTDLVWIIGAGVDRIVEEVNKGGHEFEPNFKAKCLSCEAEYAVEPEFCEAEGCFSASFRGPDAKQLEAGLGGGILGLIERPNWDEDTGRVSRAFKDLLKDATYYNNVTGMWHWEVILDPFDRVAQLWSMNSESMRRVEEPGLTIGEWFCPTCHAEQEELDRIFKKPKKGEETPVCPDHAVPLLRTAWVQLGEGDAIVAVWGAKEVLADAPRARGFRPYPRSKVHRTWALGQTMRWHERYDLSAVSGQRAPDAMVTVSNRSQAEVNKMLTKWEDWRKDNPEYEGIIWLGLGPEGGDVKVQHFLGDLVNRDFIAWGEAAMKAVSMNLGVSYVFVGGETVGKLGHPEEALQVSYDTIEENQSQLEEFVNGKLLPLFPEVMDWHFKMKPPAPESEKEKALEAISWFNAVRVAREAGADAKLDPQAPFDWPIVIDGWEDRPATPVGGEEAPEMPPLPEAPPEVLSHESGGPEAGTPKEKALTARVIPPEAAIAGVRRLEDRLAERLKALWDKAARDFKRMGGRRPTQVELRTLMADVANGLQEEFGRLGSSYVARAYRLGLDEERATFPEAEFEAEDRGLVARLLDDPDFLKGQLSSVVDDATGILEEEIRQALREGENTGIAARRAADRLGEEAWRVERIVRTETTHIANQGRVAQFEKYGHRDDDYVWQVAMRGGVPDDRVCDKCKSLAFEDPAAATLKPRLWKLADLRAATLEMSGRAFVGHGPNCRCTVRRYIELA